MNPSYTQYSQEGQVMYVEHPHHQQPQQQMTYDGQGQNVYQHNVMTPMVVQVQGGHQQQGYAPSPHLEQQQQMQQQQTQHFQQHPQAVVFQQYAPAYSTQYPFAQQPQQYQQQSQQYQQQPVYIQYAPQPQYQAQYPQQVYMQQQQQPPQQVHQMQSPLQSPMHASSNSSGFNASTSSAFSPTLPLQQHQQTQHHQQSLGSKMDELTQGAMQAKEQDMAQGYAGRYCKPSKYVGAVDTKPLKIAMYTVEKQYTMSKKECALLSSDELNKFETVPVRIMGKPERKHIFVVAKDLCLLIHTRKGNVAKSVGQFDHTEKARMRVVCPRRNGCVSTHLLLVLTYTGIHRLLSSSRSSRSKEVLDWIMKEIDALCGDSPAPQLSESQTAAPISTNSSHEISSRSASPPSNTSGVHFASKIEQPKASKQQQYMEQVSDYDVGAMNEKTQKFANSSSTMNADYAATLLEGIGNTSVNDSMNDSMNDSVEDDDVYRGAVVHKSLTPSAQQASMDAQLGR